MGEEVEPDEDRLARLFERALEVPRDERRRFLESACQSDPRLLAELTSLLASYDAAPDFLDRLGRQVLPPALDALGAHVDPVGETVGHYEIRGRIGRGGMGEVFRALDVELGREVALKFLPAHLAADGPARERLRHEARVASALDHPNIAVVYEIGTAPATPTEPVPRTFIAMAYCGRETLADELQRDGPLPLGRALDCAIQLADALSSAHEAGIVHRDVKPANLIVTDRGSLKLVDFGLATRVADDDGPRGGTIVYMSPEQLSGGRIDHRTDIWSAGVVLYEMLAGSRPFQGAQVDELVGAILEGEPPPVSAARPDVPARLAEVVHRCLAKESTSRYASATALLTDLRTAADVRHGADGGASLVVLPFDDVSPDGTGEYLSDGFTEEIIWDLSRVRALRVIASASSRRLKGSGRDVPAIARELGVRHALEGSIDLRDGTVRITASLVDARTGARTWSTTFEGYTEDLVRMRREVTRALIDRMGLTWAGTSAAPPVADARAYEAYLRARYETWRFTADGLDRARRTIENAIEIVGDHELLHGALGHIAVMGAESGVQTTPDVVGEVQRLADRVFAVNRRSAKGHWLKAWAGFYGGDLRAAIRAGEHAHALEPDNPDVLILLGYVYAHAGRNVDGRALLERALLLDPLTPLTQGVQGFIPVLEGRFADALEPYRRALAMDPESPFFATFLGWTLAYDRRLEEAKEVLLGVAERFADTVFASYARSLASGLEGRSDEATRAITPAFEAAARGSEMFARELAHCYALAGHSDRALDWLERAVELGMWNHAYLVQHDWFLEGLRAEPRFAALLESVRTNLERL